MFSFQLETFKILSVSHNSSGFDSICQNCHIGQKERRRKIPWEAINPKEHLSKICIPMRKINVLRSETWWWMCSIQELSYAYYGHWNAKTKGGSWLDAGIYKILTDIFFVGLFIRWISQVMIKISFKDCHEIRKMGMIPCCYSRNRLIAYSTSILTLHHHPVQPRALKWDEHFFFSSPQTKKMQNKVDKKAICYIFFY